MRENEILFTGTAKSFLGESKVKLYMIARGYSFDVITDMEPLLRLLIIPKEQKNKNW
ncbi:MAG: hypothetical protein R3Y67_10040 [Eubacteriales bacterium]